MTFNYSRLLGKIKECGYTQESLAKAIGVNKATLNVKLNNKGLFNVKEIDAICQLLDVSKSEIGTYFFAE